MSSKLIFYRSLLADISWLSALPNKANPLTFQHDKPRFGSAMLFTVWKAGKVRKLITPAYLNSLISCTRLLICSLRYMFLMCCLTVSGEMLNRQAICL